MSIENRLIRYCRIETQSNPDSKETPSDRNVLKLAEMLVSELQEMGVKDASVDEHGYIYAHLAANIQKKTKTVGFIAHMDTAPDYSGRNVKPRIIHRYDGRDIPLNPEVTMKVSDFPQLKKFAGQDLMVTDGTTLLGADDKAGVAAIMEAVQYWQKHPEEKHGRIAIAFTPDEEIGQGTRYFDLKKFGADFAYTMDGDQVQILSDETFNAASAKVTCTGFSIHPGEAKNRMINACNVAWEFHGMLPEHMRPEHTENREGFYHLTGMSGNIEKAELNYIIRNHDAEQFQKQIAFMKQAAKTVNAMHGGNVIRVQIKETYRNMHEVLKNSPEVTDCAWKSIQDLGLTPQNISIRGGTDGAELSFRGLPCPNLGTGGGNFHGRYEYCNLNQLRLAVQLIKRIAERVAKEGTK